MQKRIIAAGILLFLTCLAVGHIVIYLTVTAKAPFRYVMMDLWYTHTAACLLSVVILSGWFLCGIIGYVIMHYCDSAANIPLNYKEYFVHSVHPVFAFCISMVLGLITLIASRGALEAWRRYTQELQSEIPRRLRLR